VSGIALAVVTQATRPELVSLKCGTPVAGKAAPRAPSSSIGLDGGEWRSDICAVAHGTVEDPWLPISWCRLSVIGIPFGLGYSSSTMLSRGGAG
jgi:hypothetical protein